VATTLDIVLRAVDQASKVIDNVGTKLDRSLKGAESASRSFTDGLKKIGTVALAAGAAAATALSGFGLVASNTFMKFEGQMNEVFTLLPGITEESMDKMSESVKQFSKDFKVLPEKVVPGLYQAISAGVPAENVFSFLEVAQKSAVGGVSQLETAVDGISSVINAYGTDILSAANASDLMFTAVKLGKTSFDQLAQSLFNVVPVASSLGVDFSNVTAALSAMTAQGVPTSVATTQLRQVFVELSKEGTETSATFKKLSGQTFKDFIASGNNVQDALQIMEKHAKSSSLGINDLFGSVEAGNAALALTGKGTEKFSSDLAEMQAAAGATDAAYAQMETGLGRTWDGIKASLETVKVSIGEKLAPVLQNLMDWVSEHMPEIEKLVSNAFNNMARVVEFLTPPIEYLINDIFPKLVTGFTWVKDNFAIVGPALAGFIITMIIPAFTAWATAAWATATANIAAMAPLLLVAAAVAAAIALIVIIIKNWGVIADWVSGVWEKVKTFTISIWESIVEFFEGIWEWIKNFFTQWGPLILAILFPFIWLPLIIIKNWEVIREFLKGLWENIKSTADSIWQNIVAIFDSVINWFSELPGKVATFFIDLFTVKIPYYIGYAAGFLSQAVPAMIQNVVTFFSELPGKVLQFLIELWENIKTKFTEMKETMIEWVTLAINETVQWFSELPGKVWEWLVKLFNTVTDLFSQIHDWIWNTSKRIFESVVEWVSQLPGKIWELLMKVWSWVKDAGKNIVKAAKDLGKGVFDGVLNLITSIPEKVKNIFNDMLGFVGKAIDKVKNIANDVWGFVTGSAKKAKDAATTLGESITQGYKDGMDEHSPSYIERSIKRVLDVVVNGSEGISNELGSLGTKKAIPEIGMESSGSSSTTSFGVIIRLLERLVNIFESVDLSRNETRIEIKALSDDDYSMRQFVRKLRKYLNDEDIRLGEDRI